MCPGSCPSPMCMRTHLRQEPGWPGVRPPFCGQSARDSEASALRHAGWPGAGERSRVLASASGQSPSDMAVKLCARPHVPRAPCPVSRNLAEAPAEHLAPCRLPCLGPPPCPTAQRSSGIHAGVPRLLHVRLLSPPFLPLGEDSVDVRKAGVN